MPFSKSFPRTSDKSTYPKWEEVSLTPEEEKEQEILCRQRNIEIMKECIDDAKILFKDKMLGDYHADLMALAIALFEKRASHEVYFKESKAKSKFDNR